MSAPTRAPITVKLFVAFSWALGWWLVADGLHQRLFGTYWDLGALTGWVPLARALSLSPLDMGWPLVVIGTSLVSVGFGVYLRQAWSYWAGLVVCVLGAAYFALGTGLGLAGVLLLFHPHTRAHLANRPAPPPAPQ